MWKRSLLIRWPFNVTGARAISWREPLFPCGHERARAQKVIDGERYRWRTGRALQSRPPGQAGHRRVNPGHPGRKCDCSCDWCNVAILCREAESSHFRHKPITTVARDGPVVPGRGSNCGRPLHRPPGLRRVPSAGGRASFAIRARPDPLAGWPQGHRCVVSTVNRLPTPSIPESSGIIEFVTASCTSLDERQRKSRSVSLTTPSGQAIMP